MKKKSCTRLCALIILTSVVGFCVAGNGWRLHKKIRLLNNSTSTRITSPHLHRLRHHPRYKREEKLTVCDTCRLTSYDTPFYCSIQANLPQCIFPNCPKVCDEIGGDPSVQLRPLPPPPPKRAPYPHPYDLPKIPDELTEQFVKYRPPPLAPSNGTKAKSAKPHEEFPPYNAATCEFPSTSLRRIRPGSKYIEYRPEKLTYQISDIHKIASQFGLALAEFRHPMEWYSVEKSSVLESVSTYKMTEDHPKRLYVVGLSDAGNGEEAGKFLYKSDKSNPTFAVFDPRIYGRRDEQCGILTHVMGSDKRQYLTTRFWNCDEFMGGKRVVFGLFMFPPGSLCYQRSQEECGKLKQEQSGGDAVYHNTIQIGQTLARFIYLYTDQRSWEDAYATCEAKGLHMLDFDPKWDDALRTVEVIEHFLREARLNPVTTFWTAGRFEKLFSDGKFTWATTGSVFESHSEDELAAPFAFSWWDDQKVSQFVSSLSRRSKMSRPCVSVALNPETGGERPKINFKSWYCDFPMYVLCYKKINATDSLDSPVPEPTTARRSDSHPGSCEKLPSLNNKPSDTVPAPADDEYIDPFNEETCTSKSRTVKRITPNSKFVDYQPISSSYSAEQIKERCKKYGLLPAEIRTREDWDSIEKSGIDGVVSGDESSAAFFYVIGMDDSKEQGTLRYDSGGNITFSMFSAEGNNDIANRCSMLNSVQVPGLPTRGLMMQHVSCQEGQSSSEKIAYGLCMFPPSWKCFRESTEEFATTADIDKFNTIFPLGVTSKRTIFFSPVQRTREDAWKFSVAANLTLLDFDPKWGDTVQIMKMFKTKLVKDGGFFQLTPFWTSGKLKGFYKAKIGTWETTKTSITFEEGSSSSNFKWTHLNNLNKPSMREMLIEDGCVEATFYNSESVVKLRPHYCYIPKYFLMYRLHKRRGDPPPSNHLGITVIETSSRDAESRNNPSKLKSLTKRIKPPTTDKEPENVIPFQKKRDIVDEHTSNELEAVNTNENLESSVEAEELLGFSKVFEPIGSGDDDYRDNQIAITTTKGPVAQLGNSSEYYYEYYYESGSSSQEDGDDVRKTANAVLPVVPTKGDPYSTQFNQGERLISFSKGVARGINNYQDKLIIISSTSPTVLKGVGNSSEYEYYYDYESSSDSDSRELRRTKKETKPIDKDKVHD